MTQPLRPRLDILPPSQLRLWPALRPAPQLGFVLYGGTAIALRLGHRESIDFDFFSERPLDRAALLAACPFLASATTLQDQGHTWVVTVRGEAAQDAPVKLSFFGSISFGRVGVPDMTEDGVLQVASLDDLMATKVKVVLQRAEAKDYRDVAAMLAAGTSLPRALASARAMFGPNFQPSESLKALTYFNDGDLAMLPEEDKRMLISIVSRVRDLPDAELMSRQLTLPTEPA